MMLTQVCHKSHNIHFTFLSLILLLFTFCSCEIDPHGEDAKLIEHLNDLYKIESDTLDPFDMFGEEKKIPNDIVESVNLYFTESKGDEGKCQFHKKGLLKLRKELELCSLDRMRKDDRIKEEQQLNYELQKKFINDNSINVKEFYFRILKHFWTILEMENIQESSDNKIFVRKITAKIRRSDAVAIYNYLESKQGYQQIDNFFRNAFESEEHSDDNILSSLLGKSFEILELFKSWKTWLFLLWGCFIFLVIWGFTLFVIDIQQQMKWHRVLIMMLILLFGISCLVHYRHLIQVKESRRHSYLMQRKDLNTVPDECHSGGSWLGSIKRSIFGGSSSCDEYFENMMVQPEDEISPAIVISETASKFVFHPLQHFGFSVGLFFNQFYGNIPYVMILPVSVVFLVMFVIFILSYFRYGITLPFWLGSIKPESGHDLKADELKHMIKECERKIESNNIKLINDTREVLMGAREMLIGVSLKTFEEMQKRENQVDRHSLVQISTQVIENQLERMLCSKMSGHVTPRSHSPIQRNESQDVYDSKSKSEASGSNIALGWKDNEDKVDKGPVQISQQEDFLHQLEIVVGMSLEETGSVTNSDMNPGMEGSFLDKMERIMTFDNQKLN